MQLNNDRDKVSFIIGEDIAMSVIKEDMDLNIDVLVEAMRDKLAGKAKTQ